MDSYEKYLAGDDTAMTQIVEAHKDGLMLYINGFVRNIHVAEDLTEDVFFKLAVKKPKFRQKSSFKTWLFAVGRNAALDYLRRCEKSHVVPLDELENLLHDEQSVEELYFKEERNLLLHRCIKTLRAEYAQVLYLAYFENLSNEQTAKIMRKSKRQIENLIYRAKQALKIKLEKEGVDYENR